MVNSSMIPYKYVFLIQNKSALEGLDFWNSIDSVGVLFRTAQQVDAHFFPTQYIFEIVILALLFRFVEIIVLIFGNGFVTWDTKERKGLVLYPPLVLFLPWKSVSPLIKCLMGFLLLTWPSLVHRKDSCYFTYAFGTSRAVPMSLIIY